MTSNNYNNSFTVNKTAGEVFEALTQKIGNWWSTDFEGNAANTGDTFTVRFGKTFKTFQIQSVEPESRISWLCTDQHMDIAELKGNREWVGTSVVWNIIPQDFSVKVEMTHQGLNTQAECYEICEKGWNAFIASLYALLEGGDGLPFVKQ